MTINLKYRDGVTADEAALIALGLDKYYGEIPGQYLLSPAAFVDDNEITRADMDSVVAKVREASAIKSSLLNEIMRCHEYSSKVFDSSPPPEITLYQKKYLPPTNCIQLKLDLEKTTMTKISVIEWLLKRGQFDKAELINLEESFKLSKIDDSRNKQGCTADFDEDALPDNIYYAQNLYEYCWHNIPENMARPTKSDLRKYIIEVIGIDKKEIKLIESIIIISAPKGHKFGGSQSDSLVDWLPLPERNKLK